MALMAAMRLKQGRRAMKVAVLGRGKIDGGLAGRPGREA
jgi:hypothetical protein